MEWDQWLDESFNMVVAWLMQSWETMSTFHIELDGRAVAGLFVLFTALMTLALFGFRKAAHFQRQTADLDMELQQATNELWRLRLRTMSEQERKSVADSG